MVDMVYMHLLSSSICQFIIYLLHVHDAFVVRCLFVYAHDLLNVYVHDVLSNTLLCWSLRRLNI